MLLSLLMIMPCLLFDVFVGFLVDVYCFSLLVFDTTPLVHVQNFAVDADCLNDPS